MNEISTTIAEEAFVGERSEFLGQDPHEVKKSSIERVPDYHHIIEDLSERTTFMEHPTLVEVHPPAWEEMTSEKKSYASIVSFFFVIFLRQFLCCAVFLSNEVVSSYGPLEEFYTTQR